MQSYQVPYIFQFMGPVCKCIPRLLCVDRTVGKHKLKTFTLFRLLPRMPRKASGHTAHVEELEKQVGGES